MSPEQQAQIDKISEDVKRILQILESDPKIKQKGLVERTSDLEDGQLKLWKIVDATKAKAATVATIVSAVIIFLKVSWDFLFNK